MDEITSLSLREIVVVALRDKPDSTITQDRRYVKDMRRRGERSVIADGMVAVVDSRNE